MMFIVWGKRLLVYTLLLWKIFQRFTFVAQNFCLFSCLFFVLLILGRQMKKVPHLTVHALELE